MKKLSYKNENWDKFIGNNFKVLLDKIKVPRNSDIIEVAPGNSAAIGYSLSNFNFSGTLYVIEPTIFFSKKIKSAYRKLLPHANITNKEQDVIKCGC